MSDCGCKERFNKAKNALGFDLEDGLQYEDLYSEKFKLIVSVLTLIVGTVALLRKK